MLKILFLLFIISFTYAENLIVAASANTKYAIEEIILNFEEKYPDIKVKKVISSSGKLANQILRNAPYDIFLSADMKYPYFLYKKKIAKNKPEIYAYGVIVLWSMKSTQLRSVKDLKGKKIKKIAIPNPKLAPYGEESIKILKKYGIYKNIKNKIVYGESVSQTSQYIYKKLVDAGFTAKSIVLSPKFKNKGRWIEVEKKYYSPIAQGVVMLNNKKETKLFFNFLFSKKAKEILKKYGYIINE